MATDEEKERYIRIWSRVVETQMHFNEMQVKSRQLGLTFVTAALGVAVVLLSRGNDFAFTIPIGGLDFSLHVSALLVLGAVLALNAVKQLDLNVYHRMLRGAVAFGEDFEENYLKKIFDLERGMTQSISHFSRYNDASIAIGANGKYNYLGKDRVTAHDKILSFYKKTNFYLWISAIFLIIISNSDLITNIFIENEEIIGESKAAIADGIK